MMTVSNRMERCGAFRVEVHAVVRRTCPLIFLANSGRPKILGVDALNRPAHGRILLAADQ
jgi:hypothetical protein